MVDSPTGGTVEQSVMNDADSDDVEVVAASLKSGSGGSGSGSGNDGNGNDSAALRSGVSAVGAMFAAAVLSYFAA